MLLSDNVARLGLMQPSAMSRTIAALEDFARIIEEHRVEKVFAVATSVVRKAENGEAFIEQVYKKTGIPVRKLDGSEEAQLTLKGVLSAIAQPPANTVVFDIGGGSTEFILSKNTRPSKLQSTALGVLFLAESLPLSDPPAAHELSRLSTAIRKHLSRIDFPHLLPTGVTLGDAFPLSLIGTAGTVTTLAAINNFFMMNEMHVIGGPGGCYNGGKIWSKDAKAQGAQEDTVGMNTVRALGIAVAEAAIITSIGRAAFKEKYTSRMEPVRDH